MILNGANDETRIKVSGRQREWSFRNCTHTYRNISRTFVSSVCFGTETKSTPRNGTAISGRIAIYDTMQYIKCDVSTICIGLAASFGAFLLAGGAKGKRIALPNAEIMIHQPLIGGNGVRGPVTDIQIVTEQMQKTKQRLTRILSENTGRPFAQVAADTERDNYMSAQEALAYGLIDKIIDKR